MRCLLLPLVPVLAAATYAASPAPMPSIDPQRFLGHVKVLSADDMKGRFTGSPEQEKAARYIAGQFEQLGLQGVAPKKSYFQTFKVTTSSKAGPNNHLTSRLGGKTADWKHGVDYTAFNFSSSGKASAPVIFAGYGITAPDLKYDDYADLDVKGKIVLVLRHEPQEFDEKSPFNGKNYTSHAALENKAINAKMHGAKGILFFNNTVNHPQDGDRLESFNRAGPTDVGIPFAQVKSIVAERWLTAAGKSLKEVVEGIDRELKPVGFELPLSLDLQTDVQRIQRTTSNVIGYLPGLTSEYVVIGAHYDHLGMGEQFSLAPSLVPSIHPGADDNASGVAGVIELARWFAGQPKLKRGVLFMAFTGEELGLLGSGHYVNKPLLPLEQCAAMINMDMVGRMKENRLVVGGASSGSTLKALIEDLGKRHAELKLDHSEPAGFGGSDHTSFANKQIPVLFFFSGLHADYHKPSDTWDKIDPEASARLLALVADSAQELAGSETKPAFVKVAPPPAPAGGGSASSGGGYGPYFGSIPDMGSEVKGVKFAGIREGSPAAKAGLQTGDVMVEFDGKKLDGLYDYTYALKQRKPGDTVKVKVLRAGAPVEVDVTLAERR
jgi:Peptidase family M28/PDZ domain/PA domain